ncbi:uncharacterized protein BO97DRAFT_417295 [Aspergillus homomorphus CBS 101889]|uniref:Uncharacterized protein n=1 Tax=Aspergillus homomorphus (strain CBS 101889) TaxID=1450537 RepID=A0A395HLK8_ASPHC|nr:hypothetical protein BO97DRAFT_417295 [Aspergillus homomorphus CBS 101889]RAL08821.1 hypothetical protein BO97DRAFT_417295 [Aspergillus homomorphus CBS 101889]
MPITSWGIATAISVPDGVDAVSVNGEPAAILLPAGVSGSSTSSTGYTIETFHLYLYCRRQQVPWLLGLTPLSPPFTGKAFVSRLPMSNTLGTIGALVVALPL